MRSIKAPAIQKLQALLGVLPGEERTFQLLFIQNFFAGLASAYYFFWATSRFVKTVSIQSFPLAYVIAGIAGFFILNFYKRSLMRRGNVKVISGAMTAHAILALCLYLAPHVWSRSEAVSMIVSYAAFVLSIPFSMMFALGFSSLCSSVFDIAQSKRLSAMASTGETIAAILSFATAPFVSALAGTDSVLIISMLAALAAIIPLRRLAGLYAGLGAGLQVAGTGRRIDFSIITRSRFNASLTVFTFFSVVALFLADYTYMVSTRLLPSITSLEIPVIIAQVFTCIKIGELVLAFLSRRILTSRGMKFSLTILPTVMCLGAALGILTGFGFSEGYFFIFFLLLNKFSDRVVRKGLMSPAVRVLYQVARPAERVKLQSLLDGPASQLFTCVAGGLLWLVSHLATGNDSLYFLKLSTLVGLGIYAVWFLIATRLFDRYKANIQSYLSMAKDAGPVASLQGAREAVVMARPGKSASAESHILYILRHEGLKSDASPEEMIGRIMHYNPSADLSWNIAHLDLLYRRLLSLYSHNDNYFSRLLILRFVDAHLPANMAPFIRNSYELSDLSLRLEQVELLNKMSYQATGSDRFFFTERLRACLGDLLWAETALSDLSGLDDEMDITGELRNHYAEVKGLVFNLMSVLYNPAQVQSVKKILLNEKKGSDSQLFALELLDAFLDKDLKGVVIPALDDQPIQVKAERLRDEFILTALPAQERLRDLVMRDFLTISVGMKQMALQAYLRLTGDTVFPEALAKSRLADLARYAKSLLSAAADDSYCKHEFLNSGLFSALGPSQRTIYLRYGIHESPQRPLTAATEPYQPGQHKLYYDINERSLVLDTLGLAILAMPTSV